MVRRSFKAVKLCVHLAVCLHSCNVLCFANYIINLYDDDDDDDVYDDVLI